MLRLSLLANSFWRLARLVELTDDIVLELEQAPIAVARRSRHSSLASRNTSSRSTAVGASE
jgi:hypothetical protein